MSNKDTAEEIRKAANALNAALAEADRKGLIVEIELMELARIGTARNHVIVQVKSVSEPL